MPPKNKTKHEKCEVCFYQTLATTKIVELISCKSCKRVAHRYCYAPSSEGKNFTCDTCINKQKNAKCMICHNQGLLKRTSQGSYAHPICLLFCNESLIIEYKTLNFHYLCSKRKSKIQKCKICSKSSFISDLTTCFDSHCDQKAHLYCIMKQNHHNNQEDKKWVHQIKIFDNSNINYLEQLKAKISKYIKLQSFIAHKEIFGAKKTNDQSPIIICYCRQHCESMGTCFCDFLEEEETQVDWVYCDSCDKWYHFKCENITENELSDKYTCKQCQSWHKIIKENKEPMMQLYPKLHLYDLVYLHYWCQAKNYRVGQEIKSLLMRVPLTCSLKYFNEVFKNKQMISKLIRTINFMHIKKNIVDKNRKIKDLAAYLDKLDKNMVAVLWKMDFLTNGDPIQAINTFKTGKYKAEQILAIFQKYEKKFAQGLNIVRPAIKQLLKLKNVIKSEQEGNEDNQEQDQDAKQACNILKTCLQEIKVSKDPYECLKQFYRKVDTHQFLKQLIKDYFDENKQFQSVFACLYMYDNEYDMCQHTRLQVSFKIFMKLLLSKKSMTIELKLLSSIYEASSKKVKSANLLIGRQISILKQEQGENYQQNRQYEVLAKMQKQNLCNVVKVSKSHHENISLAQQRLSKLLRMKRIQKLFKQLGLNKDSLNQLSTTYLILKQSIKQSNMQSTLESFLKLYSSASKLVNSICEITSEQGQILNVDFMTYIKSVHPDRANLYRFCTFFVEVCPLQLHNLNDKFITIVKDKGDEFLNLISSRSMVFQCEIQFKAAKALVGKFGFKYFKISDLISKNRELQELLKQISLKSLDDVCFIESYMNKMKQAKQFCQDNGLQFRISKIEYMLKLFQCKQEAFRYFPLSFITTKIQQVPIKYQQMQRPKSLDFYILKKFLYKMRLLKYPENDYLYEQLNSLYQSKIQYFNVISHLISTHNCLLENKPVIISEPTLTKQQVLSLIQSKKQDFVTCAPQEEEISIIFEYYDQTIAKMVRILNRPLNYSLEEGKKLKQTVEKFPFQIQNNNTYIRFCELLKELGDKKTQGFVENIDQIVQQKKIYLDQTSAKAENSNKSIKKSTNLYNEIKNKPRTLTLQQIQARCKQRKSENEQEYMIQPLKQLIDNCKKIVKQNNSLLTKFVKNQTYTAAQIQSLKVFISNYEKQPIKMQVIEAISNQVRIYEKTMNSRQFKNTNSSKSISQSSFEQYSQSLNSTESRKEKDQLQIIGSSKIKKTKLVLRK